MVQDDKRAKIGPSGPVRPVTGVGGGATPKPTPTPVTLVPITPAPTSAPPGNPSTSYLPPIVDPLLGQTLAGRYLIQKKLGEGGSGGVYLATHNLLEKQVALKVLHGEFARNPDLVERFMQEAKAASRIRHENVIDISDFGTTPDGMVFIAMELLQGHDLHDVIARARLASELLPWDRSKRIFLQLCAALSAAHALGIIHRDLKPENIYLVEFLGEPDFVKLLDFGIAKQTEVTEGDRKLTRTGMLFGTPEYMSPEQARGEEVDPRVDVYAMGCILFQLVTGKVPFEADNFMGVLTMQLTQPPPEIPAEVFDSIGAPRALAEVIRHAMAKDRNQRIATIDELAGAVRQASGDQPAAPAVVQASVPAPAAPAGTEQIGRIKTPWTGDLSIPPPDAGSAPRRSKLPVILGALILVGGAAVAAAYLATRDDDSPGGDSHASASPVSSIVTPPPTPGSAAPPVPPVERATPPVAPPVAAPAVPPPPADSPLPFEWAQIRLDSTPPGADVKDLANGTRIGRTPFSFKVRPSHTPRQFGLHHKHYVDAVIELVPDRETIEYTEKLARGASGTPAAVHRVTNPSLKPPPTNGSAAATPDSPVLAPEPPVQKPEPPAQAGTTTVKPEPPAQAGSATVKPEPPAQAGSATVKPSKPADADCDPPCLKADPSRPGSAGGTEP